SDVVSAAALSHIDIRVEFRDIRQGTGPGEIDSLGDDFLHLFFDQLDVIVRGVTVFEDASARTVDRIVLVLDLLYLFAGAIFCRVRHRMPAIAIGQHFEDERPLAGPRMLDRAYAGGTHRSNVHRIDLFAGNIEGQASLGKVEIGGCALDAGAHA